MEDKARRAMLDAAKLADELRVEQENAQGLERDRKDLENRAHELQINLDEAEANAIKWGRKMVAKLESRAKDIEGKLTSVSKKPGQSDTLLQFVQFFFETDVIDEFVRNDVKLENKTGVSVPFLCMNGKFEES